MDLKGKKGKNKKFSRFGFSKTESMTRKGRSRGETE